jgi:murein DD-endopeptidase MepM/ murein hydrolase activator NlpD
MLVHQSKDSIAWGDGWVWPVPPMRIPKGGVLYDPVISQEFRESDHNGVDIMYQRKSAHDQPQYAPGSPDGNERFFAPRLVPILAARAGRVWSVSKGARGWAVVLDHSAPFATFYQHLETPALPVHAKGVNTAAGSVTHVKAGDIIGFMGFSPEDPERLRHLHFEVWHGGAANHAVDPVEAMRKWPRVVWAFTP